MSFCRRNLGFIFVGVAFFVAAISLAQVPDPVSISYESVWNGLGSDLEVLPVRLEMTNDGKPEVVAVKWGTAETELTTFFELPTGAMKQRVIYLSGSTWGPREITIRRGFAESKLSIELGMGSEYNSRKVGIISDVLGLGGVFKGQVMQPTMTPGMKEGVTFATGMAKPGFAPDRSVGYRSLDVLFLGEGSERLTDAEVAAIKAAVLQGLNLVFVGGAISPVVSDPRWAELMPVDVTGEVRTLDAPMAKFKSFSDVKIGKISALISKPKPDARIVDEGGVVFQARRVVGSGSVVFLAFDPFQESWRKWPGRLDWLQDLALSTEIPDDLASFDGGRSGYEGDSHFEEPSTSVFGVKMPSAGRVTAVLIAYLILVVPVNFLVLRKMKRGELAWITAPVIALGCAGILFAFAGKLYSADASRYSQGYLIAGIGIDEAIFVGKQQLFFPGTGTYNLGLSGVELAGSSNEYYDDGPFGQVQVQNRLVDMGEISGSDYSVSNLSFREIEMTQRIPVAPRWVRLRDGLSTKKVSGVVTNPLSTTLLQVKVRAGKASVEVGELEPGESKEFVLSNVEPRSAVWMQARTGGAGFGSQFGKPVGDSSVHVHYSILRGGN